MAYSQNPLDFNIQDRSPFERLLEVGQGARLPALMVQLSDRKNPVDLTDGAVTVDVIDMQGNPIVDAAAGEVVDGESGTVRYNWAEGDTDTPFDGYAQFTVTLEGGLSYKIPSNGNQRLRVRVPEWNKVVAP